MVKLHCRALFSNSFENIKYECLNLFLVLVQFKISYKQPSLQFLTKCYITKCYIIKSNNREKCWKIRITKILINCKIWLGALQKKSVGSCTLRTFSQILSQILPLFLVKPFYGTQLQRLNWCIKENHWNNSEKYDFKF